MNDVVVREVALGWVSSYLQDRRQFVAISGVDEAGRARAHTYTHTHTNTRERACARTHMRIRDGALWYNPHHGIETHLPSLIHR